MSDSVNPKQTRARARAMLDASSEAPGSPMTITVREQHCRLYDDKRASERVFLHNPTTWSASASARRLSSDIWHDSHSANQTASSSHAPASVYASMSYLPILTFRSVRSTNDAFAIYATGIEPKVAQSCRMMKETSSELRVDYLEGNNAPNQGKGKIQEIYLLQ